MASEWDTVRIPVDAARQLAAQSPSALAVLCRVLWHCRHEPRKCWASVDTLAQDGQRLSETAVRAALILLVTQGYLHCERSPRATSIYSASERLPRKPADSVFLPMEAWHELTPRELAYYAMRIVLGRGIAARCEAQAPEVGLLVRGERGSCSRATSYRMHQRLVRLGLLAYRPVSRKAASLTSRPAESHQTHLFVSQAGDKYGSEKRIEQIPPEACARWTAPQEPARLPIEAAAGWLGVKLRQEHVVKPQSPEVATAMAQPELAAEFASLRKLAGPALGLTHAAKTQTGLPQIKETKLAHQWVELSEEARADLPLLGEYIAAGGFAGLRVPVWSWICDRLLECLCRARDWHNSGRPSLWRPGHIKTVPDEESITDTWDLLRKAGGMR